MRMEWSHRGRPHVGSECSRGPCARSPRCTRRGVAWRRQGATRAPATFGWNATARSALIQLLRYIHVRSLFGSSRVAVTGPLSKSFSEFFYVDDVLTIDLESR